MLYKRNKQKIELRETFLIAVEGQTEEIYFNKIKFLVPREGVGKIDIKRPLKNSPLQLVDLAKKTSPNYTKCFAVFDACQDNVADVNSAFTKAGRVVTCIIANPCIERWLIFHKTNHNAPYNNARDMCDHFSREYSSQKPHSTFIEAALCNLGSFQRLYVDLKNRAESFNGTVENDRLKINYHILIDAILCP
jgi:hypothetical protein